MLDQKSINELVSKYKNEFNTLNTILLVGSHAENRAKPHSDIDLCIIGEFDDFKRKTELYKTTEVQLMIAPISWYQHVIESYERKGNIGTITKMLANSICLYSSNSDYIILQKQAVEYYNIGPSPLSTEDVLKLKSKVNELYAELSSYEEDYLTCRWLSIRFIDTCIDIIFQIRGWWQCKDARKMEVIKNRDRRLYELIDDLLMLKEMDPRLLSKLKSMVIEELFCK